MPASIETENIPTNPSDSSIPWFHKLSPMNKDLNIQIILFSSASVASFLLIYYFSYVDFTEYFVRNGTLPKNLSWMIYTGIGIILSIILILIFTPLNQRYYKIQTILDEKPFILATAQDQIDSFEFAKTQEIIEDYLERRYTFYLKYNVEDLLEMLSLAQKNEMIKKRYDFLAKLLNEGKKFEVKKEYDKFSELIIYYQSEIHPQFLNEIRELQKKILDIRL